MLQHPYATLQSGKLTPVHYDGFGTRFPVQKAQAMSNGAASSKSSDVVVHVKTKFKGGTRIIFWASNPQRRSSFSAIPSAERRAFFGFENYGIATVSEDGWVACPLNTPRPYRLADDSVAGRHLYIKRQSYHQEDHWTNTLYAVSCLPAQTPARSVRKIRGANRSIVSMFVDEHFQAPKGCVVAESYSQLANLAKNGHCNIFMRI